MARSVSEGVPAESFNTFKDLGTLNRHAKTLLALAASHRLSAVPSDVITGVLRKHANGASVASLGKNFECSGAFGPWLMTADEFGDPYVQSVVTRLNGVEKQRCVLREMLNSIENQIAYISEGITLRPGDVIATGTPGSLPGTDKHMHYGDEVEVEITGLGVLRNRVGKAA